VVSPVRSPARSSFSAFAVLLTASAIGVAGWLFVRYPGVLVSGVANPDPKGHVDFETFWRSTAALLHGVDIYHTGSILPNLNPPFLSVLLAPFGLLPVMPSYWLFSAVTVALVVGSVLVSARELGLGRAATAFGVLTMLACSPLHGTLLLGQIYGLLLAGLTAAWLAGRRGHPVLCSVLLALVVAVKPSLAPLLLVPLVQRRWRQLATGVVAAAGFSLVGVLAAGPSSAWEWLRLATGTPAPEVDANASLPGLAARLGLPGVSGWLITVVVLVATLYRVRGSRAPDRSEPGTVGPSDAVLFAVAAACLVAAPIAWLNYVVMLWPGALALMRAGRWPASVPLLVLWIIPVAWGNLWQADQHAPVALVGRSLYCVVLLGFWLVLLDYARPPAGSVRASAGSGAGAEAGPTERADGTDGAERADGAERGEPANGDAAAGVAGSASSTRSG
jgi:arabinofuranan 3-O-arabinosyltransferase